MALNLKNEEAERLARELAEKTGESLTLAVINALRNRLQQIERERRESRMEWLERITKETAAIMNDGRTSKEIMDELYDPETGLPI